KLIKRPIVIQAAKRVTGREDEDVAMEADIKYSTARGTFDVLITAMDEEMTQASLHEAMEEDILSHAHLSIVPSAEETQMSLPISPKESQMSRIKSPEVEQKMVELDLKKAREELEKVAKISQEDGEKVAKRIS